MVCWIGVWTICSGLCGWTLFAEDPVAPNPEAHKTPLAVYLSVGSSLSDAVQAKVLNAARKVQQQAEQEGRPAILILEIGPGTSKFGQVRDLAKELSGAKFASLRTVAWIPEPRDKKWCAFSMTPSFRSPFRM